MFKIISLAPACPMCLHMGSPDTRPLRGGHRPSAQSDRRSPNLPDRAGLSAPADRAGLPAEHVV